MGEYGSRDRGLDSSFAPRSSQTESYASPPQTPAELAADSVVSFERAVSGANLTLASLRAARDANDLEAWDHAHDGLSRQLAAARREHEVTRTRQSDATTELQRKLADAEAVLNEIEQSLQSVEAPLGWKPVSNEAGILRALSAPVAADARIGFAQREHATRDELQVLPAVESRALLSRIRLSRSTDPIAAAFAKLPPARRSRLITFLEDARRREVVARSGLARSSSHAGPTEQPVSDRTAVSVQSERDIEMVEQMLESGEPNLARLAALDGSTRRALVRRLETYRQGSGDAVGARFVRLDRAVRVQLLDAIRDPEHAAPAEQVSAVPTTSNVGKIDPTVIAKSAERIEQTAAARAPTAATSTTPDEAWAYLRANESNFMTAISNRLRTVVPAANPQLTWQASGLGLRFPQALATALAGEPLFIKLPELVYPIDPWTSIDMHRSLDQGTPGVAVDGKNPIGAMTWNFLAGEAIATDVHTVLAASLLRMVPRLLVQLEEHPQSVAPADLVTSHPMDRVAAQLLCDQGVVRSKTVTARSKTKQVAAPHDFKEGIRFLEDWHWLGSTDPKLWNWIQVKEPHDATIEDVAATLWLDSHASQYAYGITASGPYFRIAPQWARKFSPDAQYAPNETTDDTALDLAGSTLATDAAIAQAAQRKRVDKHGHALPVDRPSLAATLKRSSRQLERAKQLLGPSCQAELVFPALNWVARYTEGLNTLSDSFAADLAPVIEEQSRILFDAVGDIVQVSEIGNSEALRAPNSPVTAVLHQYAIAVGESQLTESARAQLARAQGLKADMPLALLELSASDTSATVEDYVGAGRAGHGDDTEFMLDIDRRRIADMRAKQSAGQAIDSNAVAYVGASVKERAVEVRAKSLRGELMDLTNFARDSKFGGFETMASLFDSEIRSLPDKLLEIYADLEDMVIQPHKKAKEAALAGLYDEAAKTDVLRRITATTEANLTDFIKRWDLKDRMAKAAAVISKQEQRTAIVRTITQILLLIGASVVGGIAGNMVAGAVRGALIADAATASLGMIRATNLVGAVAGLTVDAGINATAQVAIQGGSWKEAFVGNFFASAAMRVALTPLQRAAQTWGSVGEQASNLSRWQKAGHGLKLAANASAELTIGMITATVTDYVVQRIYHADEPPTEKQATDWAIQGGSMAIGSFVGKWAHGFESHLVQLAETHGQLFARARRIRTLAAEVESSGSEHGALDLLVQRQQALQEEARVIEELAANPSSRVKPSTLEALRAGNLAERADVTNVAFAAAPMRLAGLVPDDASGQVWTGHRGQIELALDQSRKAGISVEIKAHDQTKWLVDYNHQEITILETKIEGPVILAGDDADIAELAARVVPLAGTLDVFVHGEVDDLIVKLDGREIHIDHRALATYINKSNASFEKIRLLACSSGQHPKGVAQHLANKLGVPVVAPSDVLWIAQNGDLTIGADYDRNTGKWLVFVPAKSSSRYTKWVETSKPARAIDRFHDAQRADAIDDASQSTQHDVSVEEKRSELDTAAVKLGSKDSSAIREVEDLAIDSELQMSAGIDIGDPLFGQVLSSALHDAVKRGQSVAGFQKQHRRIQAQLLDALREPSLSESQRREALGRIVDLAGQNFSDNADLLRGFDAQAATSRAKKAIADSVSETFNRKMTMDQAGMVRRGRDELCSFRTLIDKVVAANREMLKARVPRELVISVSETRTALREVLVLDRPVNDDAQKKRSNASPLPVQNHVDENAVIVDVGAGESSFAIDLVHAKDRAGGPLIQAEYGPTIFDGSRTRSDLTWEHAVPRTDENSAVVLGDPLQTMDVMFGEHGVKRVFINNVNAHYDEAAYAQLATVLAKSITHDGRVEVQWTDDPESAGQELGSRGHIEGPALFNALQATSREVSVEEIAPELNYEYSIKPSTRKSGADSAKNHVPTRPVPKFRWILTFK